jgi:hypothetical protein
VGTTAEPGGSADKVSAATDAAPTVGTGGGFNFGAAAPTTPSGIGVLGGTSTTAAAAVSAPAPAVGGLFGGTSTSTPTLTPAAAAVVAATTPQATTAALATTATATATATAAVTANSDLSASGPSQLTTKISLSTHLQALARMPSTLVPERELMAIGQAYTEDPNNPAYRFRHYFHNVVPHPQQRVRPPGVDELAWRGLLDEVGGEHNAHGLWPVPGDGFKTLAERARVQDAEIQSEQDYLEAVQARVREMNRFRGAP